MLEEGNKIMLETNGSQILLSIQSHSGLIKIFNASHYSNWSWSKRSAIGPDDIFPSQSYRMLIVMFYRQWFRGGNGNHMGEYMKKTHNGTESLL